MNGWTNVETWVFAVWFQNSVDYNADEVFSYTRVMEDLDEWYDLITKPEEQNLMVQDILRYFKNQINFAEIAKSLKEQ